MTDATGSLVAQRYRLVQVIGTGGMGRVWLGRDEVIGREVAIKELLLPAGLDAQQRALLCQRAMREAQLAGQLNHPGIVTVHDVVEYNGTPMIVMEFVRGGSLSDAIRSHGALPPDQVAYIATSMLSALRVAHQAGIVHRDLKPANVLLSGDRVVITDFGIARLTGDVPLTTDGSIVGTPAYMAPEQGTGAPITPATDLWSLGATLYAAVEGRPPYQGQDFMTTLSMLLTQDPPPPRRAGHLASLLGALLCKNPADRATVDQALAMLAGVPVVLPVPAKSGVSRRTALLAGVGAVVAVGGGTAWWLGSRKNDGEAAQLPSTGDNKAASNKEGGSEQSTTSQVTEPGRPQEFTEHVQLVDHKESVSSVAWSPDGRILASAEDGLGDGGALVRIWDTTTNKLIGTVQNPDGPGGASACAVAISPDGKTLAAGGNRTGDFTTYLWNIADRSMIGGLDDSRSIMKTLRFHPDGKTLVGITHTGRLLVWDVATRKVKIGLTEARGSSELSFSPDGKLLAYAGSKYQEIKIVDPATGKTVKTVNDSTGDGGSFSPDGRTLAVVDGDGRNSMQLWDVQSGQSKAVFPRADDGLTLSSALFHPDGKTVAAWGQGNFVQLWDVASKKIRATVIGAGGQIQTVAFSPDGKRIAAGGDDKSVRIWSLES
ncbi:serine/threonine-protein kinase [Lentzea sp. BCCO 10_0798]|uniref:non-specific serine/threonine protein kinase n=1 Tax=Lentzea kristufekii TaxID=3095430 RepID=A0ABU4TN75_9PSEU|nr:serine/threonine-protein kinase [Lentzea sp. BCCO 10_0798]MDX8049728.1 serine/threonine-protein kinase [Lentzea sp. BCCO 10_0798]